MSPGARRRSYVLHPYTLAKDHRTNAAAGPATVAASSLFRPPAGLLASPLVLLLRDVNRLLMGIGAQAGRESRPGTSKDGRTPWPCVAVVGEARYHGQAQPAGLIGALERRGCAVALVDPDATTVRIGDGDWLLEVDVVVARGRSTGLLLLLAQAETLGVATLNASSAVADVCNKAKMAVILAAGGVPIPPTFVGTPERLVERVPAADYPIVLKPVFGDNCRGLRLVRDAAELRELAWPEPTALAQPYVPAGGVDLKLYGIGERVWVVRKPSPFLNGAPGSTQLVRPDPELRNLGLRCARLFGLELWGVDCVETDDGPLVIEVNDFPNYTAVPDADERLADHVLIRAREPVT
jgi:glutathione synthase/RimK-type ligase-like ATP-grasp enzyme